MIDKLKTGDSRWNFFASGLLGFRYGYF